VTVRMALPLIPHLLSANLSASAADRLEQSDDCLQRLTQMEPTHRALMLIMLQPAAIEALVRPLSKAPPAFNQPVCTAR
jgi:hypothetical protein